MPLAVTPALLARGQERYNIFCSPCHSRVGDGDGMIVERGYSQAASFHMERLRQAPLGHFIHVMAQGWGSMPSYAEQLDPVDRWAVAAYIRALQLSQHASMADVPGGQAVRPLRQIAFSLGLPEPIHPRESRTAKQPGSSPAVVPPAAAPAAVAPSMAARAKAASPAGASDPVSSSGAVTAQQSKPAEAPVHDAAAGKTVYSSNCQMCHQSNRAGIPPTIPSLVDIVPRVGAERIRDVVKNGIPNGKPPMPAFADKLSADDIENLIEYLKK